MKRVIIESPYAGDIETHIRYARRAVENSLIRNEAPLAFHLLYTQEGILDDKIEAQRLHGMSASTAWYVSAELLAVYDDYGISSGMEAGIHVANGLTIPVVFRSIGRNP